MNQKSFLEKFVIKYEQAPELLKIYNQASIRRVSEDSQSDELILLPSKSKPSYWLAEICVGAARDKYIVLVNRGGDLQLNLEPHWIILCGTCLIHEFVVAGCVATFVVSMNYFK
ncbi:uncharacterized protein LOC113331184 [Papaver somniferum]|uniref:uncharacterized protein LOC113331184 n=1 Tax=Papaver somniferum TaxID=3469 RepID=UPI000E701398|nr:uncharacterized protein LOC113331184 [Papaver somniferum]